MKIKIFGIENKEDNELYKVVNEVVLEIKEDITLEYSNNDEEINEYDDIILPAMLIDDEIVCEGIDLDKEEVLDIIYNKDYDGCDCSNCSGCGCHH